jgi:hypothetical protein
MRMFLIIVSLFFVTSYSQIIKEVESHSSSYNIEGVFDGGEGKYYFR